MRTKLLRRPERESLSELCRLALDAQQVIIARMFRAVSGTLSATEARRMVLEKPSTAVRAQVAYAHATLGGDPAAGQRACFELYRQAVRANRRRLGKSRWRWLGR
jgi:hypothetical protein